MIRITVELTLELISPHCFLKTKHQKKIETIAIVAIRKLNRAVQCTQCKFISEERCLSDLTEYDVTTQSEEIHCVVTPDFMHDHIVDVRHVASKFNIERFSSITQCFFSRTRF